MSTWRIELHIDSNRFVDVYLVVNGVHKCSNSIAERLVENVVLRCRSLTYAVYVSMYIVLCEMLFAATIKSYVMTGIGHRT